MRRDSTSSALLHAGRNLIYEGGFNQTGIQAVLTSVGVPKGSFYYYFSSKQEFGLAVVSDFAKEHRETLEKFFKDDSITPLRRLRGYFEHYISMFEGQEFRGGCLLGNLSQELADQNEIFRRRLQDLFAAWKAATEDCLKQAALAGEIAADLDASTVADFCLNAWQGALLRMKVVRSRAPLDTFVTLVFDGLLTPPLPA